MAGYIAALNKTEILLGRKEGRIDIGKLAAFATTMYRIPVRGGMFSVQDPRLLVMLSLFDGSKDAQRG